MEARRGFVYLLQPDGHNVYKIGCTVDLDKRLIRIQRRFDHVLRYVLVLVSDDYTRLEAHLHKKYSRKCIIGEWFLLSPEDIEEIRGLAT